MSAKFNPAALTRIRTSPLPGTGSGRVSTFNTSTLPLRVVTIARIVFRVTLVLIAGRLALRIKAQRFPLCAFSIPADSDSNYGAWPQSQTRVYATLGRAGS